MQACFIPLQTGNGTCPREKLSCPKTNVHERDTLFLTATSPVPLPFTAG